MIETAAPAVEPRSIEAELRDDLAEGVAFAATVAPILRHLVANNEHSVFGDEIIAHVRGMLGHVATQLLDQVAAGDGGAERVVHSDAEIGGLVAGFADDELFLAHVHSLAMEWQLTQQIEARLAIDPVLPPLTQALIASPDASNAGLAMALMAAQARFVQSQRRMELPLSELPAELVHAALQVLTRGASPEQAEAVQAAAQAIRGSHDEARSRIGLMSRLISGMGGGAAAALSLPHAGVAMFVSALALATGIDREAALLATNESQVVGLALALRASGQRVETIAEQLAALHPEIPMPADFEEISADRAAALLAAAGLPRR